MRSQPVDSRDIILYQADWLEGPRASHSPRLILRAELRGTDVHFQVFDTNAMPDEEGFFAVDRSRAAEWDELFVAVVPADLFVTLLSYRESDA